MYTLGHMNQLNSGPQSNQVTPETKPAETLKSVEAKIEAAKNGLESTREEIRANVGKPGAEGLLKSLRARFDMQTEVVTELSQQRNELQRKASKKYDLVDNWAFEPTMKSEDPLRFKPSTGKRLGAGNPANNWFEKTNLKINENGGVEFN